MRRRGRTQMPAVVHKNIGGRDRERADAHARGPI
jgi:hypothetical protein